MNLCNMVECPSTKHIYNQSLNKVVPCECLGEVNRKEQAEILFSKSNIPKRYKRSLTKLESTSNAFHFAVDKLKEAVVKFPNTKGFYFYGNTGSGKTSLACAFAYELMYRKNIAGYFAKVSRHFLDSIRSSFNQEGVTEQAIEKNLYEVPILIIDDFGIQKESAWSNQKLYDLIDTRYENEMITLVTSNLPLSHSKSIFQGRVYSRLSEMCNQLDLTDTPDYRLQ